MSKSDRQRAEQLVASPDNYNEIVSDYEETADAYSELTSAASRHFETYERVIDVHRQFIRNSEQIERWVNRDIARTIKNMVTEESKTGKKFPVDSLQDVADRLETYKQIGVEVPTLATQLETIVEALYDNNWKNAHTIIDELLADVPEEIKGSTVVYFLARTRAALALHPDTTPGHSRYTESPLVIESRRFKASTTPPEISAPATSEQCFAEADGLNYENDEKREMYALAIHKDPTESNALSEYLYLSAKNDVEKYRHRNPNPSRGRLAVAQLQFDLIAHHNHTESPDPDRKQWAESYYHVTHAMMYSSAGYESSRLNAPELEFEEAAEAYRRAAEAIAPVNVNRQLKYISKAYRHQGNATQNMVKFGRIHQNAKQTFIEMDVDLDEYDHRRLSQQLVRYHHYRELETQIYQAFRDGDFDRVHSLYIDYHQFSNTIRKVTKRSKIVEICHNLAQTADAFLRGDIASVQYYMDTVENQSEDARFDVTTTELIQELRDSAFGSTIFAVVCHQKAVETAKTDHTEGVPV